MRRKRVKNTALSFITVLAMTAGTMSAVPGADEGIQEKTAGIRSAQGDPLGTHSAEDAQGGRMELPAAGVREGVTDPRPAQGTQGDPLGTRSAAGVQGGLMELPAAGIQGEKIEIATVEDLRDLQEHCKLDAWSTDKTVVLTADIDLAGAAFQPIPWFAGVFEGHGHHITGLSLRSDGSALGLFRYIGEGAVVRDLHVSGMVAPGGSASSLGGIAGENAGAILNCSFDGSVSGKRNVGGITGINHESGLISSCSVQGKMTGEHETGGIAGLNSGKIAACRNGSEVNTTYVKVEEDMRNQLASSLTNGINNLSSFDISSVSQEDFVDIMDIGGIAGRSEGTISGSVNTGDVGYPHIGYNVGGIAGRQNGYAAFCENEGFIQGRKDTGGIAGQLEPEKVWDYSQDKMDSLEEQLIHLDELLDQLVYDMSGESDSIREQVQTAAGCAEETIGALRNLTGGLTEDLEAQAGQIKTVVEQLKSAYNEGSAKSIKDALLRLAQLLSETDYSKLTLKADTGGSSELGIHSVLNAQGDAWWPALEAYLAGADTVPYTAGVTPGGGIQNPAGGMSDPAYGTYDTASPEDAAINAADNAAPLTGGNAASDPSGNGPASPNDAAGENDTAYGEDAGYGMEDGTAFTPDEYVSADYEAADGDAFADAAAEGTPGEDLSFITEGFISRVLYAHAGGQAADGSGVLTAAGGEMEAAQGSPAADAGQEAPGVPTAADAAREAQGISAADAGQEAPGYSAADAAQASSAAGAGQASGGAGADMSVGADTAADFQAQVEADVSVDIPNADEIRSLLTTILTEGSSLLDPEALKGAAEILDSLEWRSPDAQAFYDSFGRLGDSLAPLADAATHLTSASAADIDAITDQLDVITVTFFDLSDNISLEDGFRKEDISDADPYQRTTSVISECSNTGSIEADTNTGGITGTIGFENAIDAEDSLHISDYLLKDAKHLIFSAVRACRNTGSITAKKENAGGVAGSMDFGIVTDSINAGAVTVTDGDYSGGIAGRSVGVIRSSCSGSLISGDAYVGGIAGKGDRITECVSYGYISGNTEHLGAVAGQADGDVKGCRYVDYGIGGIDNIGYAGSAEPVELAGMGLPGTKLSGPGLSGAGLSGSGLSGTDLSGSGLSGAGLSGSGLSGTDLSGPGLSGTAGESAGSGAEGRNASSGTAGSSAPGGTESTASAAPVEELPSLMSTCKVTFFKDDGVYAETEVPFGGSLDKLPEVVNDGDQYWKWDDFERDHIFRNLEVNGAYYRPITTLAVKGDVPEYLAEGIFYEGQTLTVGEYTGEYPEPEGLRGKLEERLAEKLTVEQKESGTFFVNEYDGMLTARVKAVGGGVLYVAAPLEKMSETDFEEDGSYITFPIANGGSFVYYEPLKEHVDHRFAIAVAASLSAAAALLLLVLILHIKKRRHIQKKIR